MSQDVAVYLELAFPFTCALGAESAGPVELVVTTEPTLGDDVFGLYFGDFACFVRGDQLAKYHSGIGGVLGTRAQMQPQGMPDCHQSEVPLLDARLDGFGGCA